MLVIDDREYGMLAETKRYSIPATEQRLDFGDCMFEGYGENGHCLVGVERKKLQDLINSMRDRRLAGLQLAGMHRAYDYSFLVAEGIWRRGQNGEIEELRGRDWRTFYTGRTPVMYRQLMSFLTTLELKGGVMLRRAERPTDTAGVYADLWHWFNDKEWREHTSHDQIYAAISPPQRSGKVGFSSKEPSVLWKMAAQLPGIDRRAEAVADHFKSVLAMASADEKEWRKVPGVGKIIAQSAVAVIRGEA
jgi:ERCC4-type nuclease